MKNLFPFAVFVFAAFLVMSACKSAPPEKEADLSLALAFGGVEAESPDNLRLSFTAEIRNPRLYGGRAVIDSWRVEINGTPVNTGDGCAIELPEAAELAPSSQISVPLVLNLDMPALAAAGVKDADDCEVTLHAEMTFTGDEAAFAKASASCTAIFPRVRAPEFSITAIAVLKAELINTRFRVSITISNPNPYPVELSAFRYELYGAGRLWADGTERNIIHVPAKSSVSGNLFLLMNFINMKRDLLDQIIRLDDVNYRFAGEAQVSTGVEYLPKFLTLFDLSGYSKVFEN